MNEPRTRLIRASEDLLTAFGTRTEAGDRITAEWGTHVGYFAGSGEFIYEPIFTTHYTDNLARSARADLLTTLEAEVDRTRRRWANNFGEGTDPLLALDEVLALLAKHREEPR